MNKLVLIDGHALLHRAYHALPLLTTSKGELVNAVYGFSMILLRVLEELKPKWVVATFDRKGPTFRHAAFTAYKAHRVATPDELSNQQPRVSEILQTLNIPIFELDGYEADDLIGTIGKQASQNEKVDEVVIVTGDMDTLQLVGPKVKVYTARRGIMDTVMFDEKAVKERYNLSPTQLPDYKGLAGDASDNIPGVAGVGGVTASKLIAQYRTLENLYQNLDDLSEKQKKTLSEGEESAFLSRKLATIEKNVPIKLDLESCVLKNYSYSRAKELFQELEFKSLLSKLPDNGKVATSNRKQEQEELLAPLKEKTPLGEILAEMTKTGVLVDLKVLGKLSKEIEEKIVDLEKKIYSSIGHEFNLNSPKQLASVLYGELQLTPGKKKKTHPSTDSETLTTLLGTHPVIELILGYRELFKLKSTYIDALPPAVDPKDGRVRTQWRDDVARTGRLSSTNPNLQNIPSRGEWGQKIRSAFIAPPRCKLISADYNQIELRVMAHLSQDSELLKIFREGKDIHSETASWIFHKKPEEITKDERRVAKTVNFGVLYLMSPYGLSRALQIDPQAAAEFIERYYQRFARVKLYQEKILKEAYERGYLETITGFKRYFLELKSTNHALRSAGERMAANFPVQGSAADIIKQAMLAINYKLKTKPVPRSLSVVGNLKTKLVLQVHDELVFEVAENEVAVVSPIIKEEMENSFSLSVPLVVDLKVGKNWGEMN